MSIDDVYTLIAADMQAVNILIRKRLASDVALINQIGHYIINSGGKRLRPILLLLSAQALAYQGKSHIHLAAIIEFIHTATLLHDDVVDESSLRRGEKTANELWGNAASVLVGDFLYSRSFEMMVEMNTMRVMEILSKTTNVIAEGEVLQLLNCHDPDTTEQRYLEVIHCKTAKLFEAATQLGAILSNADKETEQAMATYGMHVGTAFQLVDDILDYSVDSEQIGKNIGDDLAEGKPTLPLIYVMQHGNKEQIQLVRTAIEKGAIENIDKVKLAIEETQAIVYSKAIAKKEMQYAIAALEEIPTSKYKEALIFLAQFSVDRMH